MTYSYKPEFRKEGLVRTNVGNEIVIYDEERESAHVFDGKAAVVWRHCEGELTVDELAQLLAEEKSLPHEEALQFTVASISDFWQAGLLKEKPSEGHDRREFLELAGRVAAFSVVASVLVPRPASAMSIVGPACCTTFATAAFVGFCNNVDGCCCQGSDDLNGPDVVLVCDGTHMQTCALDCTMNFNGTHAGDCTGV